MNEKNVDEIINTSVTQAPEELEKLDGSQTKTVSAPALLLKIAYKYGVSRSEALQEGMLMLLNQNDAFIMSDGTIEGYYREKGKYKEKVTRLMKVISELGEGKK